MDASLMVEEVVEDDMERVPEDPCLGQFMGRKILQLGYWEKNSFLSHVVFQSILDQERLIEDSFEKSLF